MRCDIPITKSLSSVILGVRSGTADRLKRVSWGTGVTTKQSAALRYSHSDSPLLGDEDKTLLLPGTSWETPVLLDVHPPSVEGGTPAPHCNQSPNSWSTPKGTRMEEVTIMHYIKSREQGKKKLTAFLLGSDRRIE